MLPSLGQSHRDRAQLTEHIVVSVFRSTANRLRRCWWLAFGVPIVEGINQHCMLYDIVLLTGCDRAQQKYQQRQCPILISRIRSRDIIYNITYTRYIYIYLQRVHIKSIDQRLGRPHLPTSGASIMTPSTLLPFYFVT